jgi:hypothetical protein
MQVAPHRPAQGRGWGVDAQDARQPSTSLLDFTFPAAVMSLSVFCMVSMDHKSPQGAKPGSWYPSPHEPCLAPKGVS